MFAYLVPLKMYKLAIESHIGWQIWFHFFFRITLVVNDYIFNGRYSEKKNGYS